MRAARWPLVGRSEELRLVGGMSLRGDGPVGVVLAGAAGVGKTRLAREALGSAEKRGAVVRWATATASARALPLGAFAAALGPVDSDPMWLLRRAREVLLAGADRVGVVLGVDDAHLLDDLSATLVHQLVTRRDAWVVLTVRTGEPAPDAVTSLWKDGYLQRLELQPLSLNVTACLLGEALGGLVAAGAARDLWSITRGNPLYLQQLVHGELEAGRLARTGGVWRWVGQPRLSSGLAELVAARMGRLSDAEREVIEALAFAEPLGVAVLSGLTTAEAVERVEGRGLIEIYPDGRRLQARLGHPLYGELQRAHCGQLRARRLRGRIAGALGATGARRSDDALRRAALAVDSDLEPDADLLIRGAKRAAELCDAVLSQRLARAAVVAGGGIPARFALCDALLGLEPLDAVLTELRSVAPLVRNDHERTRVAAHQVVTLFWGLRQPEEAGRTLAAALDEVVDPACRQVLNGLRSAVDAVLCWPERAVATARQVMASASAEPIALTYACWGLVTAAGGLGRLDGLTEAVRRVDTAPQHFEAAFYRVPAIGGGWTRALRLAGLLADAEQEAKALYERYRDARGASSPMSGVVYGLVVLDQGLVRTAAGMFTDTGGALRSMHPAWAYIAALSLTLALGMAGDPAPARAAASDAEALRHDSLVFREPDRLLAQAWVAAAEGALGRARTLARQAAALAASQTQPAVEVVALHTAVCFGDRSVAARLADLAEQVEGPRAPAAAAHAAALADEDGDGLQTTSAQLEALGARLLAMDAAAQAAAVYTRQGRRGSARAAAIRAHRLAEACEGARTPALAAIAAPAPLTDREREIVTLAAHGLSNRAIADRLVISVRTVENHLYRASVKLGTTDRSEFAAVLNG
ncbi:MAG: LuxR C-terminal-related transcriptional regulator [Pseudonocardia sp.]